MRRCKAHLCPDVVSEDSPEGVFCKFHWEDICPAEVREWLSKAWGTERWRDVLPEVVREIRRLEAEKVTPW